MGHRKIVTADEIESRFGFVLSLAIPVDRNGDVPRIAVFREWNPFAPEQIFCSAVVRKGAQALVESKRPTAIFVRLEENRWADHGMYRAVRLDSDARSARRASDMTGRWSREQHGPIWAILHMERVDQG